MAFHRAEIEASLDLIQIKAREIQRLSAEITAVEPLSFCQKCSAVALIVGVLVGLIFIFMGATEILGVYGSPGFIASVSSGGIVVLFCTIGIFLLMCLDHRKNINRPSGI